jgi:hypothetical protein
MLSSVCEFLHNQFYGFTVMLVFGGLQLKTKGNVATAKPEEKKFAASHFC